jgi:hypothetical protein
VTDPVRDAVDAIENVLEEMLNETDSPIVATPATEPGSVEPTA